MYYLDDIVHCLLCFFPLQLLSCLTSIEFFIFFYLLRFL